jgi:hypothetical protein
MQSDDRSIPELRAPDQNRVLGGLADFTRILEKELGPLDMFLPVSSEFLEKASYGDPFFRMAPSGTGSRIPMTADKDYLFEGALLSALAPMARPGRKAAKAARGKRPMSEEEALSQFLDMYEQRNPVQNFAVGGGARKVKDLLADVLLGKSQAAPTKDKPDPRRRRAVGLPKDITPKPGEMVVKEEVKQAPKTGETSVSLTEAMNLPMSRRDVLRAGAGQAMSAIAPRGALGALAKAAASPAGVVEQVAKAAPLSPTTFAGIVAQGIKKGQSDKQIAKSYLKSTGQDLDPDLIEELVEYDIPRIRDPYSVFDATDELYAPGPLDILDRFLNRGDDESLRKTLREIKVTNPSLYRELIEAARETDMSIAEMSPSLTFQNRLEAAQDYAAKSGVPFDEAKFRRYYGYEPDFDPKSLFDELGDKDYYD